MQTRQRLYGIPSHAWLPGASCCSFVIVALTLATVAASACESGVLQLKALPQTDDACYAHPLTSKSIQAVCGAALRVRVKNGIVKIVPLDLGTYTYTDEGSNVPDRFNCKDLNASGLFKSGSTPSATVMMYDNWGGPLSNLTKTGPGQISLFPGRTHIWRSRPEVECVYDYTVTEGCVFGIKAPTTKPACPPGYHKKTGRFQSSICLPCPVGTYISQGTGGTCKPCPPGTYSSYMGAAKCQTCAPGSAAAKAGSTSCAYCEPYDMSWTDGIKCYRCPKGSFISETNTKRQCFKCQAGRRCCTVGWNKACPKCNSEKFAVSYTSILALESAAPTACLATSDALCAPKINITIHSSCNVSIGNMDYGNNPDDNTDCSWNSTVPVSGPQLSISDIAKLEYYADGYIVQGNFTSTGSPYLDVYIPATKCALRYRALTAPAASLLGAAPKPSKATTCPAGKYLETKTDAKPGPCLLCPPGTYSPAPSSGHACIRCAAGTYSNRYGSTRCNQCPVGRVSEPGAAWCGWCDYDATASADGTKCIACPKGSGTPVSVGPRCLASIRGSTCCAAGDCKGRTLCNSSHLLASKDDEEYTAVFQLVSRTLPQPGCKNVPFLSCLPGNGKVQLRTSGTWGNLFMETYRTAFNCSDFTGGLSGGFQDTNAAWMTSTGDPRIANSFGMVSDRSKGTVTMYLSPYTLTTSGLSDQVPSKDVRGCSATFKLITGYAFDLTPPKGAKCHPLDNVTVYGGRQFCRPCPAGRFRNSSSGRCESCKAGFYNSQAGAGRCLPCAAGYSCSGGSPWQSPCGGGEYGSKPQQEFCATCPANTFSSAQFNAPVTKCTPCPKGTNAPKGASACGVLWDKQFAA